MNGFVEHNNRAVAKKKASNLGEYITGEALRRFVADKVHEYMGSVVRIFDGAAGSGQLEEYIDPKPWKFEAVEIQKEAADALRQNYPEATVQNTSFFLCDKPELMDCAIMNPPFSLKLKNLSEDEQAVIQKQFPWKKSGAVDDIFILRALDFVKRFGFFIALPSIAYRSAEQKMRELIGTNVSEILVIKKAFKDTNIDVLFIIIDKLKTETNVRTGIYNCSTKQLSHNSSFRLNDNFDWITPRDNSDNFYCPSPAEIWAEAHEKVVVRLDGLLDAEFSMIEDFGIESAICDASAFQHYLHDLRDLCGKYEAKIEVLKQTRKENEASNYVVAIEAAE